MKKILCFALSSISFAGACADRTSSSARPNDSTYAVIERGANQRVWERVTWTTNQLGEVSGVTNSYTELGNGLCWKDQQTGKWMDADPEIIIEPNGKGLGRKAQHSIRFEPNLNTAGAIDFTTPTGNRLRSHVIAIYLRDWKTDQSLQIAGLQDSIGTVVGKDQVIYENALTGEGTRADVRYKFRKSGMSQDVIFQELISARDLQIDEENLENLEIEIWTEFLNFPPATKRSREDQVTGLVDHTIIDFGDTQIGRGIAFSTEEEQRADAGRPLKGTRVKKEWVTIGLRTFLIEKISYKLVRTELEKLPQRAARKNNNSPSPSYHASLTKGRTAPPALTVKADTAEKLEVASLSLPQQGFVADYELINTSGYSQTFRGDRTYFISSSVAFTQIILESGAVLKFSSGAGLWGDEIICKTAPYKKATLTAKDDNSLGDVISGSTGTPSGYYASTALGSQDEGVTLRHLQIKHAFTAVYLEAYESWPGTRG